MNDPLTKPSRTNRQPKRRWKKPKSINNTQRGLTSTKRVLNLSPLSQKTKVGIRAPRKGHKWPLSNVVFLCPPKTPTASCRLHSVMVGCIEQPVKRLAGSFAGSSNLIHSTAQQLELVGGGYSLYKGVIA